MLHCSYHILYFIPEKRIFVWSKNTIRSVNSWLRFSRNKCNYLNNNFLLPCNFSCKLSQLWTTLITCVYCVISGSSSEISVWSVAKGKRQQGYSMKDVIRKNFHSIIDLFFCGANLICAVSLITRRKFFKRQELIFIDLE